MTKDQLAQLFRTVHGQHRAKLALLAGAERVSPTSRREDLLAMELARGEAYLLLSQQGADAHVGSDVQKGLIERGVDVDGIIRVIEQLEDLRDEHGVRLSLSKLRSHIAATGAEGNAANIALAQPVYLRAVAEALLAAVGRYGMEPREQIDFDAIVNESDHGTDRAPPAVEAPAPTPPAEPEPGAMKRPIQAVSPVSTAKVDGRVMAIGEKLVTRKVSAKNRAEAKAEPGEKSRARATAAGWGDKAVRQARYIFDLFDRFLREEYGFSELQQLEQHHLAAFEEFLRSLHSSVGRSPRDEERSIEELREIAAKKGLVEGTLAPGTLNRHLTYIGQLLKQARAVGVEVDRDLSTTDLRTAMNVRGRDQRPVPDLEQVEELFRAPPFSGCVSWEQPELPGPEAYHRAIYFGPMIGVYMGLRREEFCGLPIDDVVDDAASPYIVVRFSDERRIKNLQSERAISIHPELIRLGFLDYARAIRALGHNLLFPDLHSPTSRSPLGDRFYDELAPTFRRCGVTTHQLRHFFNNALKQAGVSKEFRADLLGHGGESETDERYVRALALDRQLEVMKHLPIVTSHLKPAPIRLVDWVARREIAPWSCAREKQRARKGGV